MCCMASGAKQFGWTLNLAQIWWRTWTLFWAVAAAAAAAAAEGARRRWCRRDVGLGHCGTGGSFIYHGAVLFTSWLGIGYCCHYLFGCHVIYWAGLVFVLQTSVKREGEVHRGYHLTPIVFLRGVVQRIWRDFWTSFEVQRSWGISSNTVSFCILLRLHTNNTIKTTNIL